ncbi:MAG: NADH-quinone oxidoreductase subunit L [Acidimicrobiaceae bacterium]|nr:NADH-quinone oxidoreductase subunit L [Acidimicrobiaceae bacterium]
MNAVYVIVALPLLGAILLPFAGRRAGDPGAGWLATILSSGSFIAAFVTWLSLLGRSGANRVVDKNIFTWIPVGGFHVNAALRIDPLSMTMALFVTGVGSLIHLYSIGYMKGDRDFPRFFFLLNLFLFSMLVLVLADNYLFSFVGWEGVGFCSYGLVGFWFERPTAATAAVKAFVTNRVGDIGFMIALFLMFAHFKSFNYSTILGPLSSGHATLAGATATGLSLLLLLGATGKSAQIPLYMWLPDAMEGPTPVSALIHAATMVTAGVYLMARSAPIIHFSPSSQWVIAIIGAATALLAATIACAQDDIKRVLAYSTISQLGYMFLAEGSGSYTAGLFHMVTHAFFKACLFLAAGSVIHALHDEQDMKRMGGLRRYLPTTFITFIFGYLALAAIVPFSGFWSKDEVLQAAWHKSPGLWVVGIVTAFLTAYYMSRQVALVWGGQARWTSSAESHGAHGEHGSGEPHESPPVMTIPLIILAAGSLLAGLLNFPTFGWDFMQRFLAPMFPAAIAPTVNVATSTKWVLGIISVVVAFAGLFAGLTSWRRVERPQLEPAVLRRGWYIDETVAAAVSGPLEAGAESVAFDVEQYGVDGAVDGFARLVANTGRQLRRLQTGYVRTYALGIGVGAAVLLLYAAIRMGG